MCKLNTKVCLLEPKEFATNSIIDFCDESQDGREDWLEMAIFVMNKFNKQVDDSRTGSKAIAFFAASTKTKSFPTSPPPQL